MNLQRPLFEAGDDEAIARARRDIAEGKVVPHEDVREWLEKRARGEKVPMPSEWLE